ncbi:MAG: YjjW family glycine radical enzyme activase [Actinomycetia bacterium]|nr:YjjW family glycine radical enzyme activase [Actinomycetes bacterium]
MNATQGLVNNTIRFSAVDGPGNRFVVFTQGCNFNCITCHNPYTITECTDCGVCVGSCPEDALTIEAGPLVLVDRSACTDCDICIDVCPEDSTPLARYLTVAALVDEIRTVRPFISGVTLSGGEATQQPDFVRALFGAIKADDELTGLSTMVDSNGSAPLAVWEDLADVIDGAMIDLKALDPDVHVQLTARGNTEVLRTIEYLADIGKLEEVRLLIVPGYNDDVATSERTAAWLHRVDPDMGVKIIGYRAHGVRDEASHVPDATPEALAAFTDAFRRRRFTRITVV